MKKFWQICWHDYTRHVFRKRFIFALLSMPLFVALMIGVGFLSVAIQYDGTPAGYVDHSGFLVNAKQIPAQEGELFPSVELIAFADEESARAALDEGKIQAVFIVSEDYLTSGKVKQISVKDTEADSDFRAFLRVNLLANMPDNVSTRVLNGPVMTVESLSGGKKAGDDNIFGVLFPMLTGMVFMITVNISGSYLVQSLIEEKENRTMEIMVTSVSPEQLMAGKIIGNLSIGLTQIFFWMVIVMVLLVVGKPYLPDFLSGFSIDPQFIWLTILTLLPAFVLVGALMATAGATTTESREAQQVSGLFTLPIFIPYWFVSPIIMSPNSPLAVGLSLFPLTAPVALPMRAGFTDIPIWQVIISVGLLILCAAVAVWLAGRAFRLGMLRYGKRLTWKEIFGKA